MKWNQLKLNELITIKHGFAFKGEFFSNKGEYILLTPGNCYENGGLKLKGDKEKYYVGEIPSEYILSEGDLLVVMTDLVGTAPILGGAFIIPAKGKYLHNQRLGLVEIIDQSKIDKDFLYYLLNSHSYRAQVRGSASGATVKHTSPNRIGNSTVSIPSNLNVQQRIASILQSYDKTIYVNNERIRLLEKSAQLLYKEWFVNFQFPGYEKVKIKTGVPEGWSVKNISDSFTTYLGGTPSRKNPNYWNGDVAWINSGEVNNSRILEASEFITKAGLSKSAAKLMPTGTTVIAITGATLGQVSRLEIECSANQSVVGIYDEKDIQNEWVYLLIKNEINILINHASGGAQQHINKEIVNNYTYLQPDHKTLINFQKLIKPYFLQINNLLNQNLKLKKTRDILLPKLVNGATQV